MSNNSVETKHFVTFYSPGTFFSETNDDYIDSWDTVKATDMAKDIKQRYGAKPYGFRFATRLVAKPISDGAGGKLDVQPKTIKTSGLYFLGGKLETIDDVFARDLKEESILRSNMEANRMYVVCENTNSYRATIPFEEDSTLLDASGHVVESGTDPKWIQYRQEADKKYKDR